MNVRSLVTVFSITLLLVVHRLSADDVPTSAPAGSSPDKRWQIVTTDGCTIAIPSDFREVGDMETQRLVLYVSDPEPAADENGAPVQIGLTVERFPETKQSVQEGLDGLRKNSKDNPRFEPIGKDTVESLRLSDGSEAAILITEFIKDQSRHSLQIKMLTKDKNSTGWIVSAFLVAGKDSKLPVKDSQLSQWLIAHVKSFVFDPKAIDNGKLRAAYDLRPK